MTAGHAAAFVGYGCTVWVGCGTACSAEAGRGPALPVVLAAQALRQLVRHPRLSLELVGLLARVWPKRWGRRLHMDAPLESHLLQLVRARQVRVWRVACVVPAMVRPEVAPALISADDPRAAAPLGMHKTAVRLLLGGSRQALKQPVGVTPAAQPKAAGARVQPDDAGCATVPDALDDGQAWWQLSTLLEAACQGTLETWGVPAGDALSPADGA